MGWELVLFPLAILLQAILTAGVALIVAPLVVFFRDLERAVKLILRFLFYASPDHLRGLDLPPELHVLGGVQPAVGHLRPLPRGVLPRRARLVQRRRSPPLMSLALLAVGLLVFRGSVRQVLKEI